MPRENDVRARVARKMERDVRCEREKLYARELARSGE
jgi:hypothetical protein|tara:strand:- start:7937 stop:8047 length:111 start_codon:yes stop_codon:yes gene_type:complete